MAACEACVILFTVFHFSLFQVLQHSTNTLTFCITEFQECFLSLCSPTGTLLEPSCARDRGAQGAQAGPGAPPALQLHHHPTLPALEAPELLPSWSSDYSHSDLCSHSYPLISASREFQRKRAFHRDDHKSQCVYNRRLTRRVY